MTLASKGIPFKQMFLWLLLPVALGFAITRQSLWIDEGYTVWVASHQSFASFFSTVLGSPGSPGDAQMIFYLLYMWIWVKVFGATEIALRAANIPFALLLVGTVGWASRQLLRRPNAWVIVCLSPFMWFYVNEARPYVAVMAFSAVALVAMLAYLMDPARYRVLAPVCCLTALIFACGNHILAAFLFPSLVFTAVATAKEDVSVRKNFLKDWSTAFFYSLPGFVALGAFYAWTATYGVNIAKGVAGSANLAFVTYEFMGFAGLGPPRREIRETPHIHIFIPYWPWLLIGGAAILAVGFFMLRTRPTRIARNLAGGLLIGLAIAIAVSNLTHLRVLDRHLAAFFPMFFVTLMLWGKGSAESKRTQYLGASTLLMLGFVWGISDARLVFLRKYEKDSYRSASSIAAERSSLTGGVILWAADSRTAHYYGIQVIQTHDAARTVRNDPVNWPIRSQAIDAKNWKLDEATKYLGTRTMPIILVLSKPDLSDRNGAWSTLIQEQRPIEVASLTAFSIYEWQPLATPSSVADLRTDSTNSH